MINQAKKEGTSLKIRGILEEQKDKMQEWFPEQFQFTAFREDADYIYLSKALLLYKPPLLLLYAATLLSALTLQNTEMLPVRLKEIWKECFEDSDNYIDFYYKKRFQKENTLVYLLEDKIVSMLTMLSSQIISSFLFLSFVRKKLNSNPNFL